MLSPPAPCSRGVRAEARGLMSSATSRPSPARDRKKDAAFSLVLASSLTSSISMTSPMPSAPRSSASSNASHERTKPTRARKAFDRSSEATGAPLVRSRNSFMKPCFTPIDWMSGLFENRSARISSVRQRMGPSNVPQSSSMAFRPPSFSTLRATSGSSAQRSMISRDVMTLSGVRSAALACLIASAKILLGSSILLKASSIAFSKNFLFSSDILVKFDGAVPSWYWVLQAIRPGQLTAISMKEANSVTA
mmetsp:Transcript_16890/g.37119  ORF Transcript_16890/g.37119 Transcript_16890/m.37119 type:complete len:250 (+) Transcript_16890:216-965(+)